MKTILCLTALLFTSCATSKQAKKIVVSVKDQVVKLVGVNKTYLCSTSKFGEGNKLGSNKTPTGRFRVVAKIGEGYPTYQGFKGNKPTKNISGTDGIIGRILVIEGLEKENENTQDRLVKIHGTPYINQLGIKSSFGCVRLDPLDMVEMCKYVTMETEVEIH